jgi:5-methylcytosine-specific restriction endonuclease McrA
VDGARFCECLKSADWPPGADYAVHGYLDTNPSRDEVDVARAKAAELRDRELRVQVRHRDRDRCRYCGTAVRWADHRSGQGGVLDHVDPSYAAGAANLVVACRNCNSRKGNRTPAQADMVLLDPPADPVPDPAPTRGTGAGPTTHVPARDGTVTGPRPSPPPLQLDLTGGELTGAAGLTGNGEPPRSGGEGGAGDVDNVGPARTRRTRTRPNPYLRSGSTGPAPENHAGLPGPDAGPSAFDPPGYDPPDYDPPGFDPPGYDADEDPGWPPPDPQAPP